MATFEVGQQAYPTKDEIRDQILNDLVFAYDAQGVAINVLPGSDHYMRADAFAGPVSIAIANGKLARAAVSPLTAQGDDLLRLAAVHGVYARPAANSVGSVIIRTVINNGVAITVVIPQGFKATAPDGMQYQTTSANTVTALEKVELQALLSGEDGDQPAGTVLTWDSSSIGGLLPTCTVDAGQISGGADKDDVEKVRQRLLQKLSSPGIGGNSDHVRQLAGGASAAIDNAWVYCGIRGPGSVDVAISGSSDDRTLGIEPLSAANAALVSELPGNWSIVTTTVVPEPVDIVFDTTLPLPQNAGGAGGGWLDADPWPAEITKITAITANVATVDSTATPTAGNRIGVWDPDVEDDDGNMGTMREYEITEVIGGGAPGAWEFTVQGGFLGNHTVGGAEPLVSAGAFSLVQYAKAVAAEFRKLGPGEKTTNVDLLPRARRQPTADVTGPMNINSRIISNVEVQFPEIAMTYAARYETGTTTPITSPSVPATTADPPNIITLEYLSFIADV